MKHICIQQARDSLGEIDPKVISLINEVGRLCSPGEEKQLAFQIIEQMISDEEITLSHPTLVHLSKETANVSEGGNKENYDKALEIVKRISYRAISSPSVDDEGKAYSIATIWDNFVYILFNSFQFGSEVILNHLNAFEFDDNLINEEFSNVRVRLLFKIGLEAINQRQIGIAYSILSKLHGIVLQANNDTPNNNVSEINPRFLGLCAYFWISKNDFRPNVRDYLNSFLHAVDKDLEEAGRTTNWGREVTNAERFFFNIGESSTANYLGQMYYELNQFDFVIKYLTSLNTTESSPPQTSARIAYRFSSIESLATADLYSLMSCGVTEEQAHIILANLPNGFQSHSENGLSGAPSNNQYGTRHVPEKSWLEKRIHFFRSLFR